MPERITDRLKRITREQGGAAPPVDLSPPSPEPRSRRYGPFIALGVVVLLAAVGWLLIQRLMATSKFEDCMMSGRRNCAPIDTTTPP